MHTARARARTSLNSVPWSTLGNRAIGWYKTGQGASRCAGTGRLWCVQALPPPAAPQQACRRARSPRKRARQTRSRAGADVNRQRPPHCFAAQRLGCLPAAASTRSMACLAAAATSCSPASATSARRRSTVVAACAASSAASAAAAAARAACRATLAASLARLCAACAASSAASAAHGRAAPARPPATQPARASPRGRRLPRSNSARWSVARGRQVRHLQRHPRHASIPRPACTRMTTASWPTSGAFARARVGLARRAVSAALRGQAQLAPRQLPLLHQRQLPLHRGVPRRLLGCEVGQCPVQPRRVPVLACRARGRPAAPVPQPPTPWLLARERQQPRQGRGRPAASQAGDTCAGVSRRARAARAARVRPRCAARDRGRRAAAAQRGRGRSTWARARARGASRPAPPEARAGPGAAWAGRMGIFGRQWTPAVRSCGGDQIAPQLRAGRCWPASSAHRRGPCRGRRCRRPVRPGAPPGAGRARCRRRRRRRPKLRRRLHGVGRSERGCSPAVVAWPASRGGQGRTYQDDPVVD
jgi:hypothetical protein